MRIFPLGESALTVDFGNEISVELNQKVLWLASFFEKNPFPGMIEIFPAYSSLTIFYSVSEVRKNFSSHQTAFNAVKAEVEKVLSQKVEFIEAPRTFEIPVCFDKAYALDLDFVASRCNLAPEEVIEIFLSRTYRVFMIGFLPGFAYMGEVDERIAVPRLENPRTEVEKGSIGIAGRQTGIYPLNSPGGWRIIGKTSVAIFNMHDSKNPSLLRAGDLVRFYRV
ncbi:MAG: 5-oxoprolinase subunit PxpB [Pyrinomonadaceae bacterium]|jgi:inhibitor of KinA